MDKFVYYLATALESGLSAFGIRAPYEQPPYQVVQTLPANVEIRAYPARDAVETPVQNGDEGAAFGRLFRYITGANHAGQTIAMTVPVQRGRLIAMTIPVQTGGEMRFFLPRKVAEAGAPTPNDPLVHVVTVPAEHLAALRFSGVAGDAAREKHEARLMAVLAEAHLKADGPMSLLSYDPPFTPGFLRRNEVVVRVGGAAGGQGSAPDPAGP